MSREGAYVSREGACVSRQGREKGILCIISHSLVTHNHVSSPVHHHSGHVPGCPGDSGQA